MKEEIRQKSKTERMQERRRRNQRSRAGDEHLILKNNYHYVVGFREEIWFNLRHQLVSTKSKLLAYHLS